MYDKIYIKVVEVYSSFTLVLLQKLAYVVAANGSDTSPFSSKQCYWHLGGVARQKFKGGGGGGRFFNGETILKVGPYSREHFFDDK